MLEPPPLPTPTLPLACAPAQPPAPPRYYMSYMGQTVNSTYSHYGCGAAPLPPPPNRPHAYTKRTPLCTLWACGVAGLSDFALGAPGCLLAVRGHRYDILYGTAPHPLGPYTFQGSLMWNPPGDCGPVSCCACGQAEELMWPPFSLPPPPHTFTHACARAHTHTGTLQHTEVQSQCTHMCSPTDVHTTAHAPTHGHPCTPTHMALVDPAPEAP
jgi:hypothetical protein